MSIRHILYGHLLKGFSVRSENAAECREKMKIGPVPHQDMPSHGSDVAGTKPDLTSHEVVPGIIGSTNPEILSPN